MDAASTRKWLGENAQDTLWATYDLYRFRRWLEANAPVGFDAAAAQDWWYNPDEE